MSALHSQPSHQRDPRPDAEHKVRYPGGYPAYQVAEAKRVLAELNAAQRQPGGAA